MDGVSGESGVGTEFRSLHLAGFGSSLRGEEAAAFGRELVEGSKD